MKPLPLSRSIPLDRACRHNTGNARLREILWVEQILQAIQHLHRGLPAHVSFEHAIQNRLRSGSELGGLLLPVPMPQAVSNDVSSRLDRELLRIGTVCVDQHRHMGRMCSLHQVTYGVEARRGQLVYFAESSFIECLYAECSVLLHSRDDRF